MRIGILTLPQETNYGGILQAFALQRILRKMGHDAITIDRHNLRGYPSLGVHLVSYLSRLFNHYVMRKNVTTLWRPYINDEEFAIISQNTQRFINANMEMTDSVLSGHLSGIDNKYKFDAYVVGSDQVWLEYYCPESFLDFVRRDNVKRVVYAASCGRKSFFMYDDKVESCRKLAKDFSGISVREASLKPFCKDRLGIEAVHVLDPTMLLEPKEYLAVLDLSRREKNSIVFNYILDNNDYKKKVAEIVSDHFSLPVKNGNVSEYFDRTRGTDINNCIYPSVEDWLYNLSRSSFVVTDSFHGTVFAILFNKPFITIANKERGYERFASLLSMFGLESRLITEGEERIDSLITANIDYSNVNGIISQRRYESLGFLKNSLEK